MVKAETLTFIDESSFVGVTWTQVWSDLKAYMSRYATPYKIVKKFGDFTEANIDALAAYITNPDAGALPPSARGVPRPALPGVPPGQTRFSGRYNNLMFASDGLPAIGPPWTSGHPPAFHWAEIWRNPLCFVPGPCFHAGPAARAVAATTA